jgi:dihydrofolate reductase
MSKIVLYIAQSLDGFIAKSDGNLDWLTSTPPSEQGDYGYTELLNSIGTLIMGRKTYDIIIGFGEGWAYSGKETFVVTNDTNLEIKSPETHILTGDLINFVSDLKARSEKDIWLMGGGQLIKFFIDNNLLDKMIISIIPKIIGGGIPLFPDHTLETDWKLENVQQFETGLVNLTYLKPS